MTEAVWTAVDRYFEGLFAPPDAALEEVLTASVAAGMPAIQVSPLLGKLLHLLALSVQARTILELGTLGGYSSIWLARALPPGGQLITLEVEPHHAEVARANLARAGLAGSVEVRVGLALETLPALAAEGRRFDLVFIDADKEELAVYFRWARSLTRRGGLIIVDNVVRRGEVINADSADPRVQGVRAFHAAVAGDPGVTATALQTTGVKGYDGITIALVTGEPLPPPEGQTG